MKQILGSVIVVFALGAIATLVADEDLPSKIDVVIVDRSSSSVASNSSTVSSNSTSPESSASQSGTAASSGSNTSAESGSSQGDDITPDSSAGTAAIRRVDSPSVVPQGDKWFDTKGRRLGKKPAASGSYVNNGKMQTVK